MSKNIVMPSSGAGGTLARWLVKVGDRVRVGDTLAEVETDKATTPVESPHQGTVAEILVPEGTTEVAEDQVLAVIAD
jgi:pyruvate dehydrogenase E2 component (dihydrolipoamide acetyltransferase)